MSEEKFDTQGFVNKVLTAVSLIQTTEELEQSNDVQAYSSGFQESQKEAEAIVEKTDVRRYICPGLQTCSSEAIEIAKTVTPVLVGAVLAGTIVIPLNPILFGWIALVIAKAGVSTLCHGIK